MQGMENGRESPRIDFIREKGYRRFPTTLSVADISTDNASAGAKYVFQLFSFLASSLLRAHTYTHTCTQTGVYISVPCHRLFLRSRKLLGRGVRELEISGRVGDTKFLWDRDGYPKISRFSNESGFPKVLGFGEGLVTRINNSSKPTPSTTSKGRRSGTIIRAIPSVVSFGLTIFSISFCTCDKFYIDSVSFLVHVLMYWMHMLQMA